MIVSRAQPRRLVTRSSLILLAAAFAFALVPRASSAFTQLPDTYSGVPDETVSYCVSSTPDDVGTAAAEARLDAAIDKWEGVHDQQSGDALQLSRVTTCSAADITVEARNSQWFADNYSWINSAADAPVAAALPDTGGSESDPTTMIVFNDDKDFEPSTSQPSATEYSYWGVLTHEMGHTIGLAHAGDDRWSPADDDTPTMVDLQTAPNDSWSLRNLQADDEGGVVWVAGGSDNFWSPNPGFEDGSDFWTLPNGSFGSNWKLWGDKGAKLVGDEDYLQLEVVYDPWIAGSIQSGMDQDAELAMSAYAKRPSGSGDIRLRIKQRAIVYVPAMSKGLGFHEYGDWTTWDVVGTCTISTGWLKCDNNDPNDFYELLIDGPYTVIIEARAWDAVEAVEVRFRVQNKVASALWMDKVGVFGGTNP